MSIIHSSPHLSLLMCIPPSRFVSLLWGTLRGPIVCSLIQRGHHLVVKLCMQEAVQGHRELGIQQRQEGKGKGNTLVRFMFMHECSLEHMVVTQTCKCFQASQLAQSFCLHSFCLLSFDPILISPTLFSPYSHFTDNIYYRFLCADIPDKYSSRVIESDKNLCFSSSIFQSL